MLHKYDEAAADAVHRQAEFAFEMTNSHYGDQIMDSTFPLRNSIVKYLMGIHGIVDKFFNY